jgi:hypothetical protein
MNGHLFSINIANIKQFSCLIPSASVLSIIQKNWRLTPNKFPFDENKFFT